MVLVRLDTVMQTAWTREARGGSVGRSGDLAELYRLHAPSAFRLAYLITGDRALAEDLTQDAFVKVFGRFRHLREQAAFGGYLRQAVVNLANSYFRRARLERTHLRKQIGPQPSVDMPALEQRDELRSALLTLPIRQRAAIVLRFYEDLSERETAEVMGISPGAVKSLVARGMGDLRTRVDRESERQRSGGSS